MSDTLGKDDKWTFYQDPKNDWRWKRQSTNNKLVGASTEGYKNKKDCLDNAVRHGYVLPANQVS